ncbi:MAG TPA: efflux RND transporter periplasmic adaptor subunit [Telluria sp.]|nr:efflux RND transporter periplasmic adaptor subunit [Telluria sp.]
MNTRKIALAALMAVLAAGLAGGGYWLGASGAKQKSAAPAAATKGERRVLYWVDPMVPGPRFDKAGKSPFMDMPLQPVYADEGEGGNGVAIDPRVQQNLGIRTAEVTQEHLIGTVQAVGNVAWNERDTALLQARSAGFVERVHVRAAFDPVRRGQPLVDLYVPDWVAAQEDYLAVRRMHPDGADPLVSAALQRMRLAGMTEEQMRAVAASGRVQARMTVVAPQAGVVVEVAARDGMTVAPGTPLFRLAGLDRVWVEAEVPEQASDAVAPGAHASVSAPALGAVKLEGTVAALLPSVDAATRTRKARIELPNPGHKLAPGMFVQVGIERGDMRNALTVPSEAVIQTGSRAVVFVAGAGGRFEPVNVVPGAEANGRTEIRGGLAAGQRVVVSGQFLVDSEASLKGVAARMQGRAGPADVLLHHGTGRIEAVGKDTVTISHGPIDTLKWGAMTMDFQLPPGGLPAGIGVGDTVHFTIGEAKGGFRIEQMSAAGAHGGHQ